MQFLCKKINSPFLPNDIDMFYFCGDSMYDIFRSVALMDSPLAKKLVHIRNMMKMPDYVYGYNRGFGVALCHSNVGVRLLTCLNFIDAIVREKYDTMSRMLAEIPLAGFEFTAMPIPVRGSRLHPLILPEGAVRSLAMSI